MTVSTMSNRQIRRVIQDLEEDIGFFGVVSNKSPVERARDGFRKRGLEAMKRVLHTEMDNRNNQTKTDTHETVN